MDKPIIFVLNVGRSGSMSVAEAFGLKHEPDRGEPRIHTLKTRINFFTLEQDFYGETNNAWKTKIPELKKEFPDATYIHLIRNGRDVVKSYYIRGLYGRDLNGYPDRNQPIPDVEWFGLDRFSKVCHYWRYWNEYISQHTSSLIRLEDISYLLPKLNETPKEHQDLLSDWDDEKEEKFWAICGELMQKYNYR